MTLWELTVGDVFKFESSIQQFTITHCDEEKICFDSLTAQKFAIYKERAKFTIVEKVSHTDYSGVDIRNWIGTAEAKEGEQILLTNCKVLGMRVSGKPILDEFRQEEKPVETLIYETRQKTCPGCGRENFVESTEVSFNSVSEVKVPHIRVRCNICQCWWVSIIKYKNKSVQPIWSKIVWKVWDMIVFTGIGTAGYFFAKSELL